MPRNPTWTRDELILALDFYISHLPLIPGPDSKDVIELSQTLNALWESLGGETSTTFRNPNGVSMKLMNFRRLDPAYEGKGLERGGKGEEEVWRVFADKPKELSKIAEAIKSSISTDQQFPNYVGDLDDEDAAEGRVLTRTHKVRERNPKIVKRKKEKFLKDHGKLFCEACEFDFSKAYGSHGDGYIECHHTKPVSELLPDGRTKLSDLVVLCANCHRMVHRIRPWLTVEELKEIVRKQV